MRRASLHMEVDTIRREAQRLKEAVRQEEQKVRRVMTGGFHWLN